MNSPGKKCILLFSSNSVLRRKPKARLAERLSVSCISTNLSQSYLWFTGSMKKAIYAHNALKKDKKEPGSCALLHYTGERNKSAQGHCMCLCGVDIWYC